jgi:YVTN family beta-propeller protein
LRTLVKELKYVINKYKLYYIAVVSTALIFMLVSTAGAIQYAYISNSLDNTVSVIDITINKITASVPVGTLPKGVAVNPDGTKVYVTNLLLDSTVSAINTTSNSVADTVNLGLYPYGVAVTPDGSTVYVANTGDNTVSVINTSTNAITTVLPVENYPIAFGQFIGPILSTPTITWTNPADIVYGTPLSNT